MRSFIPSALLFAGSVAAQAENLYTATGTAAVAAAAATAKSLSPTSNVKGKAFDRFVTIWLENTDYDMSINDRTSWSLNLSSRFIAAHCYIAN
jgi:acid phosphatase